MPPKPPASSLASTAAALVATVVVVPLMLGAAPPAPILVVPSSEVRLELAVDLPAGVKLADSDAWQLVETHKTGVSVPAQRVTATAADGAGGKAAGRLLAVIPPRKDAPARRRFRLEPAGPAAAGEDAHFKFQDVDDKSLALSDGSRPVLTYNHGVITKEDIPEKDHRRSRACYIHPLWGLGGELLTEDFPKDHYHHHGVFWTWPHIVVDGREYDLWAGPSIKQKFVQWLCRETGPVAAVLAVENGWFIGEKKVMIERVWIRPFKAASGSRSLDLEFTWIPVDQPVTIWGAPNKSYGGLTIRFGPLGRSEPATVITVPSGPTEADLPEAPLPWADYTSKLGGTSTFSGAAIFVDPAHPDYPPTWLTRHYGALCVGWPGVNSKTFEPGEPIRLNYRIWIHESAGKTGQLQQAYDAYAAAQKAKWR